MSDRIPEPPETKGLTQRELLLLIQQDIARSHEDVMIELRRINGTVRVHNVEIYGSKEQSVAGLKPEMQDIKAFCSRMRTSMRVLAILGGFLLTAAGTAIGIIFH